jgi:hypothetical protein
VTKMSSPTRPRGGFNNNAVRPLFNAPSQTATRERTSQWLGL